MVVGLRPSCRIEACGTGSKPCSLRAPASKVFGGLRFAARASTGLDEVYAICQGHLSKRSPMAASWSTWLADLSVP